MSVAGGEARPAGGVTMLKIPSDRPGRELDLKEIKYYGFPHRKQPKFLQEWKRSNVPHLMRGTRRVLAAQSLKVPHFYGQVWLRWLRADGDEIDLGLVSNRVVTTAGVNYIVGAFTSANNLGLFKFHALGTGTAGEVIGDTALGTELTTQYNPDNTRATGTTTVGASNNIYRTVATNTVDAAAAVTEHGILTQAATGGGTLLDRSVFSAVNLANGDSLQSTYELTLASGG